MQYNMIFYKVNIVNPAEAEPQESGKNSILDMFSY